MILCVFLYQRSNICFMLFSIKVFSKYSICVVTCLPKNLLFCLASLVIYDHFCPPAMLSFICCHFPGPSFLIASKVHPVHFPCLSPPKAMEKGAACHRALLNDSCILCTVAC